VDALRSLGVQVISRLPVVVAATPFSEGYLETFSGGFSVIHSAPTWWSTHRYHQASASGGIVIHTNAPEVIGEARSDSRGHAQRASQSALCSCPDSWTV